MSDGPFHSQRQKQVQDHPSSAKKQGRGLGGSLHEFKRTAGENVFRHLPVRRQRRFRSRTDSAAPPHLRPFPRTGLCTTLRCHVPPSTALRLTCPHYRRKRTESQPFPPGRQEHAGRTMSAENRPIAVGPSGDGTFADKTSENVCSTARRRVKKYRKRPYPPPAPSRLCKIYANERRYGRSASADRYNRW